MTLITIVLITIGLFSYAVTGNIIIRILDDYDYITSYSQPIIFLLGLIFPLVLFYIGVKEIAIYFIDRYFYK